MQRATLVSSGHCALAILLVVAHVAVSVAAAETTPAARTYYANETAPQGAELESWHTILGWLDSSDKPDERVAGVERSEPPETRQAGGSLRSTPGTHLSDSEVQRLREIAGQLRNDRRVFPETVDRETAAFREHMPDAPTGLTTVVFTNRLVRNGKYLVFRGGNPESKGSSRIIGGHKRQGGRGWTERSEGSPGVSLVPRSNLGHPRDIVNQAEEGTIEPLPSENFILTSNPLARADMFVRCLREVARRFDPTRHNFVLVTTSHGNTKMAMTPRLCVRAAETTREELMVVAAGQMPDDELPSWAGRLSVTKDQYFDVLGKLGQEHGMHFALVFMLACNGTLDDVTTRPPENVHKLYMTGPDKAAHGSLDYADLLARYDGSMPLSDIFEQELAPRFPMLVRGEGSPNDQQFPRHTTLYWLPLGICLVCFVWRRFGRSCCA